MNTLTWVLVVIALAFLAVFVLPVERQKARNRRINTRNIRHWQKQDQRRTDKSEARIREEQRRRRELRQKEQRERALREKREKQERILRLKKQEREVRQKSEREIARLKVNRKEVISRYEKSTGRRW